MWFQSKLFELFVHKILYIQFKNVRVLKSYGRSFLFVERTYLILLIFFMFVILIDVICVTTDHIFKYIELSNCSLISTL